MAHGLNSVLKRNNGAPNCKSEGKTGIGSRRIFPPHFKLQVLDSYRNDPDCKGNQRATARKYGIHRRQIQKWLQVENNLRHSVGKAKSGDCVLIPEARKCGSINLALRSVEHRQRDDQNPEPYPPFVPVGDARVPAVSPAAYSETSWPENTSPITVGVAPLDFTTHSRVHGSPAAASPVPSPCDPSTPIDLSLKRPISVPAGEYSAPVCFPPSPHRTSPLAFSPTRVHSPTAITLPAQSQSDVWDLSTKTFKRKYDYSDSLYSPNSTSSTTSSNNAQKPFKLFKPYEDDINDSNSNEEKIEVKPDLPPPCCTSLSFHTPIEPPYFNNNCITPIKSEYSPYTLHELQPKNALNYYYPITKPYISPLHEAEIPSNHCCSYDEPTYLQLSPPLKQRQTYSLDFKLSAIDCYYQDDYCRGNQRAVASKYNIHRRQVQKWLKQEDELRHKIETVKQLNVVS